jgi:DNA-binding NtrC family response regulator
MVGRPLADWDASEPQLRFFEHGGLDEAFTRMTETLRKTERQLRARREQLERGRRSGGTVEAGGLIARSDGMRKVIELARRVARVDATVLVTGESGAGKEGVARLIHDESARAARPFVAVNCAAVPESLLESELFGHARGAFTGASSDRAGLFEAASGGTLFLDEIGDVPPAMQVRLLRVLQEREVRRVGENQVRKVDVRVVAATNRDLAADVLSGRFRQDLYYRLRVIELHVPPLRERPDDILPLARLFLDEATKRLGGKRAPSAKSFTARAAQQLLRYRWPGNVRELENAIERAAVLAEGERVDAADLPDEVRTALTPAHPAADSSTGASGRPRPLAVVERDYILGMLDSHGGNRARTAEALGIGPATLYRKLKAYRRA